LGSGGALTGFGGGLKQKVKHLEIEHIPYKKQVID
jgi:O6-methylguanine-DNA--protein-cysteine methyltransferase